MRIVEPSVLSSLENTVRQFAEGFNQAFASITILGNMLAAMGRRSKLLDQAGFLPHVTTPLHLIESADSPAELSASLERYYRDNWGDIRPVLLASVESYPIDDEAKQAYREALVAHESGLYRLVCRRLFPEIERVARIELQGGVLQNIIRSRPPDLLQKVAGELGLSETQPGGLFTLELFRRLTDHLYVRIGNADQRKLMEEDAVPNRHASVHGLVVYSSFKNSLNTLFMTDYAFQIVRAVKARIGEP